MILSKPLNFEVLSGNFLGRSLQKCFDFVQENILAIAVTGLSAASLAYLTKVWHAYGTFKRLGLKTPKYEFFFGHYREILKKNYSDAMHEWTKTYGKTYGIFEGHFPILVTSDPELIQEIFIKRYSSFMARRRFAFSFEDDDPSVSLFTSCRGRWKRQRNVINPTFSTSKLKELMPIVTACSGRFFEIIDQAMGSNINPLIYLRRYTMDIIWNCAFGVDLDCQHDPSNKFFVSALEIFDENQNFKLDSRLSIYFYEFRKYILGFLFGTGKLCAKLGIPTGSFMESRIWLFNNIKRIIDNRIKNPEPRKDYLNILLEVLTEQCDKNADAKSVKEFSQIHLQRQMTQPEIIANLNGFMIAGYETTSSSLNYSFYVLAKHPEQMRKLQDEVDALFKGTNVAMNYDSLNKLEYMELFIKEVLRFYSTANLRCTEACEINGIKFAEHFTVVVDVLSLHFNPEYWGEDVNEFNPLRFQPHVKRHPAIYIPFGLGPRSCVGMRFAMLEMKMTLAKLLLKYDIVANEFTPEKLEFSEGGGMRTPKTPVQVTIRPRHN